MRKAIRTAAAIPILAVLLAGCYEQDVEETDPLAVGVDADVGPVQVRSLLVVSAAVDEPGRLLGTFSNTLDNPAEVTIADADEEVSFTVDGGTDLGLDTSPVHLGSIAERPGSRVPITVTVGSQSVDLLAPVMDGSLDPYAPYLPTIAPSSPAPTR
ncbi:hypothetical protein D477_011186 [Arthrobacter crystallopoietes BAB-32]|uniref:Lipoprotein n=1 Tax=Arthrobacter crystallopoietes BAB-32 TaxID=1246476 RepID=N1V7B6_9MICC|nr:hypothetical protein [Arthrobacter crystallopoietes]EMY34138.1 hypothetical protein D477_011186 [Arthrobacter crystallopoietes BAB-32]